MNITFEELRKIKHALPTGSVARIANELDLNEQTVRNFFGAQDFQNGEIQGIHVRPGPNGGFVNIKDSTILDVAKRLIEEASAPLETAG